MFITGYSSSLSLKRQPISVSCQHVNMRTCISEPLYSCHNLLLTAFSDILKWVKWKKKIDNLARICKKVSCKRSHVKKHQVLLNFEPSLFSLLEVELWLLCVHTRTLFGKLLSRGALQGVLKSLQGSLAKAKGHKQRDSWHFWTVNTFLIKSV